MHKYTEESIKRQGLGLKSQLVGNNNLKFASKKDFFCSELVTESTCVGDAQNLTTKKHEIKEE